MYISQAQALLDGTTFELYEMNKYAMDNSSTNLGPYLYQTGFPILLAGTLSVFGLNFYAMKGLCAAGLVLSIPLLFRLFREQFETALFPLLIVVIVSFHSAYIVFSDSILSDLPFYFFSLLVLNLIRMQPTLFNQIMLGFMIYFSYIIRDIGIVLLPTLAVYQLHQYVRGTAETKWKLSVLPYIVFGLFLSLGKLVLPAGQENHFSELFSNLSANELWESFKHYRYLLNDFFYFPQTFHGFFYLMIFLAVAGCIHVFKRTPHLIIYVVLSGLILMIWPYKQGTRFLFPILPFLVFFIISGMQLVFERVKIGRYLVAVIMIGFTLFSSFQGYDIIKEYAERDTNGCQTEEMKTVYHFMATEIPRGKLVANYYPRVLRLFTGLNSVRANWGEPSIDYYQTGKKYVDAAVLEQYSVVFETENEAVLERIKR
jgi:hypothetical protein